MCYVTTNCLKPSLSILVSKFRVKARLFFYGTDPCLCSQIAMEFSSAEESSTSSRSVNEDSTADSCTSMSGSESTVSMSGSESTVSTNRTSSSSPYSTCEGAEEFLWELCCHPNSNLTRCCQRSGKVCRRLTLETGFDFTTAKAKARASVLASQKQPRKFWVSCPCTAYSPCQNLRRWKTRASNRRLQRKQAKTDKIVENCLATCKPSLAAAHTRPCHLYFEWSSRCHGWKRCRPLAAFKLWLQRHNIPFYFVRIHSCVWGLRTQDNEPMKKCCWADVGNFFGIAHMFSACTAHCAVHTSPWPSSKLQC